MQNVEKMLFNAKDVGLIIGKSDKSVYRYINPKHEYYIQDFPKPITTLGKSMMWRKSDLVEWIENK